MRRQSGSTFGLVVAAALVLVGCASYSDPPEGAGSPPTADGSTTNQSRSLPVSSAPVVATTPSNTGSSALTPTPAPISVGAQRNRALATAEAQRLLGLADLPTSATRLTGAPAELGSSVLGTPATKSLIDIATFWTVPISQKAAGAWIRTHAPRGLDADRSSTGVDGPSPGDTVIGFGFSDHRTSHAWTQGVLEISVSFVDAHTSAWRVEGEAIWLDPTPAEVKPGGDRMRVDARDGCPASDQGKVSVTNTSSGLDSALTVSGSPSGGLVCVYHGMNDQAFRLAGHHILSAATARDLAELVSNVSLARDSGGTVWSCPSDDEAAAVLVLSYAGKSDVDLWLHTSGCPSVDNGEIEAWFTAGVSALSNAVLTAGG